MVEVKPIPLLPPVMWLQFITFTKLRVKMDHMLLSTSNRRCRRLRFMHARVLAELRALDANYDAHVAVLGKRWPVLGIL